jgi:hypothetical protein
MTNYEQFGANIYDRPKMGRSLGLFDYNFPELTINDLEIKFKKSRLREYTPTKEIQENQLLNGTERDTRSFFEKYTPANMLSEIMRRIKN